MDAAKLQELATMDPEMEKILKENPIASLGSHSSPEECRKALDILVMGAATSGHLPTPDLSGVKQEEIQIPTRDGKSVRALKFSPANPQGEGPLVLAYHGGGFVSGAPEYDLPTCAALASNGCTAISVDYRMAPEFPFPYAVHDCWDALKWAVDSAKSLGADPSKGLLLSGISAGANLAAVVALQARDEGLSPPVTGVNLVAPIVIHPDALPAKYKSAYLAWDQCKDAPLLDKPAMEFFLNHYNPDPQSQYFSALLWPTGHANLPPHTISVYGQDPLRDDGLIYEQVLKENGVKTKLTVYPGLFHTFFAFRPAHSATQKALQDAGGNVMWLMTGGA